MSDLPVACTLDPAALSSQKAGLLRDLVTRSQSRVETGDGVTLTFTPAAGLLSLIAEVVEAERRCCRFLRFELIVESGERSMQLRLSGPPGTREFLQDLLPAEASC